MIRICRMSDWLWTRQTPRHDNDKDTHINSHIHTHTHTLHLYIYMSQFMRIAHHLSSPQQSGSMCRQMVWPLGASHNGHNSRRSARRQNVLQQRRWPPEHHVVMWLIIAPTRMRQLAGSVHDRQLHGMATVYRRTALAARRASNVLILWMIMVALQRQHRR